MGYHSNTVLHQRAFYAAAQNEKLVSVCHNFRAEGRQPIIKACVSWHALVKKIPLEKNVE